MDQCRDKAGECCASKMVLIFFCSTRVLWLIKLMYLRFVAYKITELQFYEIHTLH